MKKPIVFAATVTAALVAACAAFAQTAEPAAPPPSLTAPDADSPAAAPPPAVIPAPPSVTPAPVPPPAAGIAPSTLLSGAAAIGALVGNSIRARGSDGGSVTLYFQKNGSVKQLDDDETSSGKWSIKGDALCLEFPDDDDEDSCYTAVVSGTIATLTDEDGAGRRYEILPGNPANF